MSNVTVGVYIFDVQGRLLVCHPSEMGDIWGIPKGMPNPGEVLKRTAIREVHEETGILLKPYENLMQYVGMEPYSSKDKKLIAFTVRLPHTIDKRALKCISTFRSGRTGMMTPEVDRYLWVDFAGFEHMIQSEQVRLWNRYRESHTG